MGFGPISSTYESEALAWLSYRGTDTKAAVHAAVFCYLPVHRQLRGLTRSKGWLLRDLRL